ncbi:MAG TPA: acyl-CoA dehydrogenase family protein, partial [Acidimicrobiia bacterium]|nr:acyl-CoA dehydrogenase family protein [Acidimicrobiia bacterium]
MDFDLPAEAETFRDEVRAFVREHAPEGRFPPDWTARLAEAGYVAPHWPKPYGLDADPIHQLVIDDELRRAGVRRPENQIGIG